MANMWDALGTGLANAQEQSSRLPSLRGGYHVLKITHVELKQTRQHGQAFIVEFEIVATSGTNLLRQQRAVSWYQGSKNQDAFFSAVKGFVMACLQADPQLQAAAAQHFDLATPQGWAGLLGGWIAPENTASCLVGRVIGCRSEPRVTKGRGILILDHRFEPAIPEDQWSTVVHDPANPPRDVPDPVPQAAPQPYAQQPQQPYAPPVQTYAPPPYAPPAQPYAAPAPQHYAPPVQAAPPPAPYAPPAPQHYAAPVQAAPPPAPYAPPAPPAPAPAQHWGAAPPPPPPLPPGAPLPPR